MLALFHLVIAIVLGALICRRFYRFASPLYYVTASFLIGILLSTWFTYLFALLLTWSKKPLVGAAILFFLLAICLIYVFRPRPSSNDDLRLGRPPGSTKWDAVFIAIFFLIICYLTFGTMWLKGGTVRLAFVVWNDFGPNLSLMQSFAIGHNFPTEYPDFIGVPIRQHFFFWFEAGNLEFLGLNIAWALNLLSALSFLAMIVLVMALGETLFKSRAVGRIAAALFFFPTTLAYVPFLQSQKSLSSALAAIRTLNHWLVSDYRYPGEDWGTQSLGIFYVQRHLLVAIGILLLVLIFLVHQWRLVFKQENADQREVTESKDRQSAVEESAGTTSENQSEPGSTVDRSNPAARPFLRGFILSGILLGLLPMWNSAVFVAAAAVLAGLFVLLPLRKELLALGIAAGVVGLPQILYLGGGGSSRVPAPKLIHWGYTVIPPTIWNVVKYLGFTFGFKWLLIAIALLLATRLQRRMFIASLLLILLAFLFQFSVEIVANHKFLNLWVIFANFFVAYALWRIWRAGAAGKAVAIMLAITVSLGGAIEWFRIHNDTIVDVPFNRSRLATWLLNNTKPSDIFLSDKFVLHPILLNGRRIFYGWSYFAWSLGYKAAERDALYKQLWTTKAPDELKRLLKQNHIRYVAVDNGVRAGFKNEVNEMTVKSFSRTVFSDDENLYGRLVIYEVPEAPAPGEPVPSPEKSASKSTE